MSHVITHHYAWQLFFPVVGRLTTMFMKPAWNAFQTVLLHSTSISWFMVRYGNLEAKLEISLLPLSAFPYKCHE